jgi:metal-responsive CopG/Arc/MetJ family transcriptional regulator
MVMVRTTITLPEALLSQVDDFVGDGGRSAWISEAIETKVKRERLGQAIAETRGALKDSEWWKTPEETYRWVREQRTDREEYE